MTRFQRWLLHLSTLAAALSGAVYGTFKYFGGALSSRFPSLFSASDDAFTAIRHPLQLWGLDVHVLAGPVLIFACGLVFKDHVLGKLAGKAKPARRSGLLVVGLLLPLVLSGYLLQMITNENLRLGVVATHVAGGAIFAATYLLHVILAPKRTERNGSASVNGRSR